MRQEHQQMVHEIRGLANKVARSVGRAFLARFDDFGCLFQHLLADSFYPACKQLRRVGADRGVGLAILDHPHQLIEHLTSTPRGRLVFWVTVLWILYDDSTPVIVPDALIVSIRMAVF
jgi:hypothetical protein